MSEAQKDTHRSVESAKAIIDGRDPGKDFGAIMVTLEGAVATVLLTLLRDPRKAAAFLNEGLIQGVERRLALYASRNAP
jgi:hypothetical protein